MMNHENRTMGGGRQSEAKVRDRHLEQGALLLQFTVQRPGNKVDKQALDSWRAIEKKGFLVTTTGCLIPAPCHTEGNSKKKPAYETAMKLFWGRAKDPATKGAVNQYGWPAEEQTSHLCHDNACCCYKDLEVVPQWQNLKRNYCGFGGTCDCGSDPPCKCRYLPSNVSRDYDLLSYDTPNVGKKVRDLLETNAPGLVVAVKILQPDHYKVQDEKRANRGQRIKRKAKHDAERDKKAKKRKLSNNDNNNNNVDKDRK